MNVTNDGFKDRQLHIEDYLQKNCLISVPGLPESPFLQFLGYLTGALIRPRCQVNFKAPGARTCVPMSRPRPRI